MKELKDAYKAIYEKKANDGNLANNAPPYDKVTRRDVITGALGKDEMGGKRKAHDCAKKVNYKKEEYDCIPEQHTMLEDGTVTHYDITKDNLILHNIPVEELEILISEKHEHFDNYDKNAEVLGENRRAARAAGGYKDDSKKQPDPSKDGFTGIGNMSIDAIRKMSARIEKEKTKKEEVEVEEGYKGKHGQTDKQYADSRSQGGKMISGDSKMSGAEYTHGRRVKAANPGMQPDVGGKTKPKSQGRMDAGTRADLKYRKANLKKEETVIERADTWHPDPEQDRKLGGPGANQRAREDRAAASKPAAKKEDPKKLRKGESYMDYAKRQKGGSSLSAKPKKKSLLGRLGIRKEEAYDAMKDRRMERGGVDGNTNYRKAPPKFAPGPSKKKYDGMSAVDMVKADIRAKYGKGAIIDKKKK